MSVITFVHNWDGTIKTEHFFACSIIKYYNSQNDSFETFIKQFTEFLLLVELFSDYFL